MSEEKELLLPESDPEREGEVRVDIDALIRLRLDKKPSLRSQIFDVLSLIDECQTEPERLSLAMTSRFFAQSRSRIISELPIEQRIPRLRIENKRIRHSLSVLNRSTGDIRNRWDRAETITCLGCCWLFTIASIATPSVMLTSRDAWSIFLEDSPRDYDGFETGMAVLFGAGIVLFCIACGFSITDALMDQCVSSSETDRERSLPRPAGHLSYRELCKEEKRVEQMQEANERMLAELYQERDHHAAQALENDDVEESTDGFPDGYSSPGTTYHR